MTYILKLEMCIEFYIFVWRNITNRLRVREKKR